MESPISGTCETMTDIQARILIRGLYMRMITGMTVLSELKARICTEGNPRLSRPMIEADLKVVGHAAVRRMACLDAATEMERSTREDLILDTRLDVSTKNLQIYTKNLANLQRKNILP